MLRTLGLVEVHSFKPIGWIAFDDDGLVILDRDWGVSRVWQGEIDSSRGSPLHPAAIGSIAWNVPTIYAQEVWSVAGQGLFVRSRDEVFRIKGEDVRRWHHSPVATASYLPRTVASPEPSRFVIREHGTAFDLLEEQRVIASSTWTELLEAAGVKGRPEEVIVRSIDIWWMGVHASVHRKDGALTGALTFLAIPPFRPQFTALETDGDIDHYGNLVLAVDGPHMRYFLFGKTDLLSRVFAWELFKTNRQPCVRVIRHSYKGQTLPSSGQNVPVIIGEVRSAPHSILVRLLGDSILRYDQRAGLFSPIFHPGTSVSMSIGDNGWIAFSAFNGYKVFLLHDVAH